MCAVIVNGRALVKIGTVVWAAASLVGLRAAVVGAQPAGRTVWDGAYTTAQAERAVATYDSVCSRCHTLTAGAH